jgi:NTP pyrophosphatase (non-canonical NTP hydrolase)
MRGSRHQTVFAGQYLPMPTDNNLEITVSDQTVSIGDLRLAVEQFVSDRDWDQYHSPKNLAMSIAIEAAELMEHFQWLAPDAARTRLEDEAARAEVADELADILIYCLSFANSTQIDVSRAIVHKLERNRSRFPVERVRGRLGEEHRDE